MKSIKKALELRNKQNEFVKTFSKDYSFDIEQIENFYKMYKSSKRGE